MNIFLHLSFLMYGLTCVSFATAAEIKCSSEVTNAVGRYLQIDNFSASNSEGHGRIVAESCKQWPDNANIFLAAFAYTRDAEKKANAEYEKNLIVAVIDKTKHSVIRSYQNVIQEDALTEVGPSSLRLDTARYRLSKDVRAFGLVFNSVARGASCGEAHWNNELTLFVPDGKKLRQVFQLFLFQQKSQQGCLSTQSPDAIWESAALSIGLEKTQSNGYADLLVTARISPDTNSEVARLPKARVEQSRFRYDGKFYVRDGKAPWWLEY